jgi:hypothetical protein
MPSDARSPKYRSTSHARNIFVARSGIARAFGGLGSFLAIIFLGSGVYLLQESFTDPLQTQAVGLIAGAFIIALAAILIYFIFTPGKRFQTDRAREIEAHTPAHSLVPPASPLLPPKESVSSL